MVTIEVPTIGTRHTHTTIIQYAIIMLFKSSAHLIAKRSPPHTIIPELHNIVSIVLIINNDYHYLPCDEFLAITECDGIMSRGCNVLLYITIRRYLLTYRA
uniref:Uncharacterized protein n=1 Tax=Cacopsylla melanoneura TaxID=428564 RepID=A0A8D8ZC56_9HEMI